MLRARHVRLDAAGLRRILSNPREVCRRLRLDEGARAQPHGLVIRCPWHEDHSPSCSVRVAGDGTIAVHCFGCGETGDVLDLVAVAHSLRQRSDFPEIIRRAADLAGTSGDDVQRAPAPRRAQSRAQTEPQWPSAHEVARVWSLCRAVSDAADVAEWLRKRALDPSRIDDNGLARALPSGVTLPWWARFQRRPWPERGYRCVLPMFDQAGTLRSLRVRCVTGHDGPKALPPTGHRVGGLVMADSLGRALLAKGQRPELWPEAVPVRVIIAEGEPDFLTWATAFSDANTTAPAVFGIVGGSWTPAIASRVPDGSRVIIRTDHDEAGEKYAGEIHETLNERCTVLRGGADNCDLCPEFGWTKAAR